VAAWITAQPIRKQKGEIQDRLVLAMVNEAARVLESGIVSDPRTLDLAMIFGTGFPPFQGGPLRYADSVGIKVIHQKLEMLATVAGENYAPCQLIKDMALRGQSFYQD
jgi:3-hydroxyacyl-CoA dehydrogenase